MNIVVLGHRGLGPTSRVYVNRLLPDGVIPENSLLAFEMALNNGAHGVELDVYLTSDNQVVVCRDDILDRNVDGYHSCWTANEQSILGKISEKTLSELQLDKYSLGLGQKIPTLKSVIELMIEHKKLYGINFKLNIELQGNNLQLAAYTWDIVRSYIAEQKNMLQLDNFIVNSFNKELLIAYRIAEEDNPLLYPYAGDKTDLMLGVFTQPLFGNDELFTNYVPVIQDAGVFTVKQKIDEKYLQTLIDEIKKYDIRYIDIVSADLRPNLLDICRRNSIKLAMAYNPLRSKTEYMLQYPDCDITQITYEELEKLQLFKLYTFAQNFPKEKFYYKTDNIVSTLKFLKELRQADTSDNQCANNILASALLFSTTSSNDSATAKHSCNLKLIR